ncbi:SusC/RagA family TonB-linked outer membrane protein [Autumnicola psychrophila]|uniref:TonB-dependent receptor n=1 Tax=Autumnicola psychrophila TaxID=3075592 RepID=A0ABU3DNT7_9FLAO|nr:TonB-dependent receptor [Zunongwangia sp. F225]MDT0684747.1 TonB-dependent receptor [Zunongwangia sp. F225]
MKARKLLTNNSNAIRSGIFFLLLCLSFPSSFGAVIEAAPLVVQEQEIEITGTVISEADGMPLPGVNVMVKGTTVGTVTDFDGNYSITVPSSESALVFSFLGFKTIEETVGNRRSIDVNMFTDENALNEVVVVGYGAKKRESLTGAIEQVDSEAFQDRAVTNPALALQGQTPGLTVTRSSPRPGNEDVALQIRGATSVNGGEPLVVIDGVPVIGLREFYNMNPDDIESVSVLKDGAASIYGSRAANGVILVTTKDGKGKMTVEYKGNFRLNTIGIRPPAPSMEEYATLWLDAVAEDGTGDYWGWANRENLERLQQGVEGIYRTPFWGDIFIGDANRFDELYGNSYSHQQNLSISGSTEKTNYRLSASFADNKGALKTAYDGQKEYNVRFNYDFDVSDRFSLQTGVNYQRSVRSEPSSGLGVNAVSFDPPFFPALNPYGQWYANFGIAGNRNSTAATTDGGRRDFTEDLTRIFVNGEFDIFDKLSLRGTASFNKRLGRDDLYYLTVQPYTWAGEISPERINSTPLYAVRTYDRTYQNYGAFLEYAEDTFFENHTISALIGVTADLQDDKNLYAERTGLEDLGVYDLNVAPEDNMRNGGGQSHWGLYSYLARFNYDFQEKYLIELIGRRDGSSRFAPGYKWSNFGSISAGWIITKEKFMSNLEAISFAKLRGSYGEMGNQEGIGLYDYVSGISRGSMPFGLSPQLQSTSQVSGLTSDTRTWERVKMSNIAIDLRFLENRLSATFEYFEKENDGMLVPVVYPDLLGGTAPRSNSGVLETQGWEAIVGWNDKLGDDFSYNISANMSNNTNELVQMEGQTAIQAGLVETVEGYPLNSYFLYETDGFLENQEAVNTYYDRLASETQGEIPVESDATQALRPGDTRRIDLDGNGYIDDIGGEGESGDVKFMGDAAPHYTFGINLGANWKGFDFNAMFQGVLDQNVLRTGYLAYPFYTLYTNQNVSYLGETWTENNTTSEYPRLTTNTNRARWNWGNNDFMLQNNRYIRLKNIVLGYTIPSNYTKVVGMEKVRFYFSGNDLFEITSIKDGYDPETGESTNAIYPFTRTWALGVNITF